MPTLEVHNIDPIVATKLRNIEMVLDQSRGAKAELCRLLQKGDNLFSLLRKGTLSFDSKLEASIVEKMELPKSWRLDVKHKADDLPKSCAKWITDPASRVEKSSGNKVYHRGPMKPAEIHPQEQTSPEGSAVAFGGVPAPAQMRREGDTLGPVANALTLKIREFAFKGKLTEEKSIRMLTILMEEETATAP